MKILSVAGDRVAILLADEDTHGQYTVMESVVAPGAGPPPHVHEREDEMFQVLAGEITIYQGEKAVRLQRGDYLFAARGLPHSFRNTGKEEARMIITTSPAGIEKFFEKVGKPLAHQTDQATPPTAEEIHLMQATAPEYGITILPPKTK
jgi:quercetin dioxygenase-like cupin family protein